MLSMSGLRTQSACIVLMLAAMAPLLAGCNEPTAATAVAAKPPEPEVGTFTVRPQARALIRELPGRIAPTRVAEVRARVSGNRRRAPVPAGHRSEGRRSAVPDRSQAVRGGTAGERSRAGQGDWRRSIWPAQQARRIATLTSQRAAPEAENEKAIGAQRQAEAEVGSRQADVARAKLDLDYATIRAPISGVVGAALVSEGALVVQNETTSLATIQQLDPIYADFTQSVAEMNKLRRAISKAAISTGSRPTRPRSASCSTTERSIRFPASCCSPKPRSTPSPARSRCAASSPTRSASCCRACMSAC